MGGMTDKEKCPSCGLANPRGGHKGFHFCEDAFHYRPVVVRPRIVCLCGSTRFIDTFRKAEFDETLAGRIVLTIGCDTKSDDMLALGPDVKERLDELHKRKIDLADEILVLNVDGYIGESTRSEIRYANRLAKLIRWWDARIPKDVFV